VNAFRFLWGRLKEHPLARGGTGLITGVADDDPSGIATYSQAGAQFGLNMLWTMPLAFPTRRPAGDRAPRCEGEWSGDVVALRS
jgi:hypothetical protein